MTTRLQQAISEAQKLSPEAQDALALRILADLRDEEGWDASFRMTSDEQWDRLAARARAEIAAGGGESLQDFLK